MSFLTLIAALLLGYYRPVTRHGMLQSLYTPYAHLLERSLNDGRLLHGAIAWSFGVLLPVLVVGAGYFMLLRFNLLLGMVFAIGVLYVTLHFGHFGGRAEAIAAALRDHNVDQGRVVLADWENSYETTSLGASEISRVAIEATLRDAHYELFAPIFWFILLGPAGALLYRLAFLTRKEWARQPATAFNAFAEKMFTRLDWLPVRFTAGCFAVVGDFEDAVYCWRMQALAWADQAVGIILASGAGAIGVRLGEPLPCKGVLQFRPEIGMGDEADADYLMSAVGLIWRVLVLMVVLLLLLTFAHWLGN